MTATTPLVNAVLIMMGLLLFKSFPGLTTLSSAKHDWVVKSSKALTDTPTCEKLGWFPSGFGLKDHSVFWYNGYYYLVSGYFPGESYFAYGRSIDLCDWEDLTPVLNNRTPGAWDEMAIWAPMVFQEGDIYYLYYTGVTGDFTQSIMLATTSNPDNPASWNPQGMVFQPKHNGMVWQAGSWSDCRDATIIKVENTYYMYYTALDISGGIIGLATASSLYGPWRDWGTILTFPGSNYAIAESSTVYQHAGLYYLFYNNTSAGEQYRIGASPAGPWSWPLSFTPGWAHEVWEDHKGQLYTSYLISYSVNISPMSWDTLFSPPRPVIGKDIYHIFLPSVTR
jgi:hypothetical protein